MFTICLVIIGAVITSIQRQDGRNHFTVFILCLIMGVCLDILVGIPGYREPMPEIECQMTNEDKIVCQPLPR
jgi:hypothetical protein